MKEVDQKEYTQKYFESDCEGHEEWQKTKGRRLPKRLEVAFDLVKVKKGMQVLDFGSGRGEMAYLAAKKGANVLGVDYSDAALKLAKQLPKDTKGKLTFKKISDLRIPLKDNSVDLIYFVDVIEHLYPKQLAILLTEFRRVLKIGGKVALHTAPNKEFYDGGYQWYTRRANLVANVLVWRPIFKDELEDMANPRSDYERKVHVNECSVEDVTKFFTKVKLGIMVWPSSEFRMIRLRDKIRYLFLQPQIGPLKRWFANDIWAIAEKSA